MTDMYGIKYKEPKVIKLQDTGIGVAELAARTCYDSFENSENDCIREFDPDSYLNNVDLINSVESSELLDSLAWVHHHHSIIEHAVISFYIEGTSRGVLQEHARHRIQSISVRSTRYTMSNVINAFVASRHEVDPKSWFIKKIKELDMFVVDSTAEYLEIIHMFEKLMSQLCELGGSGFHDLAVTKSSRQIIGSGNADEVFEKLQAGKKKRNVGDAFKWIVTDNWKVNLVVTFNIRSLKNYFDLRDSGAAYFQINWLAEEMKKVTPMKYLKLIDKKYKDAK